MGFEDGLAVIVNKDVSTFFLTKGLSMQFSLRSIPISKIRGDNLARSKRTEMYRLALLESVRTHGILQPILCQLDGEYFRLIAGFGRVEAANNAGITEVPAQVYEGKLPEIDLLILACQENNIREGMSFLDQADHLERIVKVKKITETEAGKLLGLKQSVTSKIMSANARLADDVKLEISRQGINYSVAYILSKATHDKQRELLRTMIANKWTRAQLEAAMRPEATRSLSYGTEVKFQVSYPTNASYEVLKEHLKKLMNEVLRCERLEVPIELMPKMVQS